MQYPPLENTGVSVDPMRQFASPYLYAGNGVNPINGVDDDGNVFANTASTKVFVKKQYQFIGPREHCGATMEGVKDQINLMNGVSDDYKMLEAYVTLSVMGNRVWAEALNISTDEAEARIAAHELGAHIRGFSPKTNLQKREEVEHDNFSEIEERLRTPNEPSENDLRYQYKAYE